MSELWGESSTFFALDAQTGKLLWRYDAEHSIRNNAIAIGAGRVFLIDRPIAKEDEWNPDRRRRASCPPVTKVEQPPGQLLALDAATGKIAWKSDQDAFGTMLAYSPQHDALLMAYQSTRFKLPSEVGGRLAVFRGATGEQLWDKAAKYVTRPLINDRTIYAQGGSWDLLTGEDQPFVFERSYGCGQLAGSQAHAAVPLGHARLPRPHPRLRRRELWRHPSRLLDQRPARRRPGARARRLRRLPVQLSEPLLDGARGRRVGPAYFLPSDRCFWKKRVRICPHSSPSTCETLCERWLRRGSRRS